MSKWIDIIAAGAFSCALFMVLHAFPWQRFLGQRLKPPWTYVAGILGLAPSFTVVIALWGDPWPLWLAASVVIGAGGAVIFGYKVRGQGPILFEENTGRQEEINMLRERVAELERKLMAAERRGQWRGERSRPKA
jgi:hypothetical protein